MNKLEGIHWTERLTRALFVPWTDFTWCKEVADFASKTYTTHLATLTPHEQKLLGLVLGMTDRPKTKTEICNMFGENVRHIIAKAFRKLRGLMFLNDGEFEHKMKLCSMLYTKTDGFAEMLSIIKERDHLKHELISFIKSTRQSLDKLEVNTVEYGSFDKLDLVIRTRNSLKSNGINTIEDLTACNAIQILNFDFIGKKGLENIRNELGKMNLYLNG